MQRLGSRRVAPRWCPRAPALALGLVLLGLVLARPIGAQQVASAGTVRGPRFLITQPAREHPVVLDVNRAPVLLRRISVDLDGVPLKEALAAISARSGLALVYGDGVIPTDKVVHLRAEQITVAAALTDVLVDVGVDVLFNPDGGATVVPRQTLEPAVQTGTVTGRVSDAASGAGISGVEVRVVGMRLETMADDSGQYVLHEVPVGEQRVAVRRIGYQAQTQTVTVLEGGTATLDFALSAIATRLDELVTTVTGDQRRLEVGNTIATINADSLMAIAPVMSFGDLLQGRAPGVLSLQEGGYTGQAGRLRIRGLNSLQASNDPIVVVDGVRVETSAGMAGSGRVTGRLADLDPDEIASVEVIKGPSAATLYGTDAANGVLVITTKRGQPGRTRWTAFAEQGLLEQQLDYANQFLDAYYAFGRSTATNEPQRCTLLQRAEGSCVIDSLGSFNTFTNPATRPFKDGSRQQYGLQVSGGTTGGTTYFLSGNYEQETGPIHMPANDQALVMAQRGVAEVPDWQVRPNAYERVNLLTNLTAPLGQRGSVMLSTGFVSNQARRNANFPFNQVGYRDVNDGWLGGGGSGRPAYQFAQRGKDVVRRFTGSLAATYSVRDWLTLRGTVGADLSTTAYGELLRRGDGAPGSTSTGQRTATDFNHTLYSLDLGATATRALSTAVSSKTSLGVQYNRRAERSATILAFDLPLGSETVTGAGMTCCNSEATLTTAVAGGYIEEVLGFRDRLFLTGALRFDGGSAFGQDFAVTAYPKASASWVVTDGQAGPRLPGVTALRLRAAYGASGVQPGPTDALARVAVENGFNVDGTAAGPTAALIGGNPDLRPERSSELEAGLDLELWASRVRMEFTAYQRTSEDALVSRPNAPSVGGSRIENLGSVRNRGLELMLSADLVRGWGLAAGFTVTGALNENRLLGLGEGVLVSSPTAELNRQEVGYPLQGQWGFMLESFADANGDGIIEPAEIVLAGPNTQYIGPNFPTQEATVAPYVKLFGERLHLSGLLQYRGGFYRWNSADFPCGLASCRAVNDLSTPLAEQARAVAGFASLFNFGPNIEDASYFLLRELSLGFTVPVSMARVLGARAGQVVLAGRNLALLWKASDVPLENAFNSADDASLAGRAPGPSTYWLLRVHLTY